MKKTLLGAMLTAFLSLAFIQNNFAQDEWTQGRKGIYSIGIGGTEGIAVGGGYYAGYSAVYPPALAIDVSGEYKVWEFIGLGWQTGINILPRYGYIGLDVPLMIKCNIHIMDAAGVSIADKLDVYAGLGVGAGPGFITGDNSAAGSGAEVFAVIHVGPQVGVRYWFSKKVGIFGEFGWGATFANAGVSF